MSKQPFLTIGIPIYNGERYIRESLDSIISQDYSNLEIIISDNCSTDKTKDICLEYADRDSRIKYYEQETNLGATANFNFILKLATGTFFTWAAYDDYLATSYVRKCIEKMQQHPTAIGCCSEINFVNEDGTIRTAWTQSYSNIDSLDKNVVGRVRELTNKVGWYAIYSIFKTDVLRQTSLCQSRYADDVLLLLELLLLGEIVKVPEYLFYYRVPTIDRTPEDYIRIFTLDTNTIDEIRRGSFTYIAKQVLNTVYNSSISIQDKHRIKADFIKTLTYHNQDWLSRIANEQKWTDIDLIDTKIQKLLESTIVSDKVAKSIAENPPLKPTKTLVFFPHNPYPSSTGAHRRCLEMLAGLRDLGCEIVLFSSNLYTDREWTQSSVDILKSKYGIDTFIYQATETDARYLEACRARSQPGKMNWDYFNAPGLVDSFKQIFRQIEPNLVVVSYSLWGRLVSGKEFDSVVKVIDTIDLFTLTMQMFQILTPHFSQQSIDPLAIAPEVTNEAFFANLNICPEQTEYDICNLYDYTLAISQKEGDLLKQHTRDTKNLYVPMTVTVPDTSNSYTKSPLFVISGNCFNLQGASYFVKKVLPLISTSIHDFKLQVVGAGGDRLTNIPELDICGFVEDLSSLYAHSGFAICPLIGGTGQQVKIVEAMAHGLPVVALINVAETSPIEHGINGFIASNAEEFAKYTILLWNDRNLCKQMGEAARKTMAENFSASSLVANLQEIVVTASQLEWKTPQPQIAIDAVFFQLYSTGIARVWKSLLQEWANNGFAEHLIILDRAGTAPKIPGIKYHHISAYDYANTDADRIMLQNICEELGVELFISSYYTTPLTTPSVFMTYDMIPEVMGWNLSQPMWQEKLLGIQHASAYITISEYTASDLVECYPDIDPQSITVAHCGVSSIFTPAQPQDIATFKAKYGITKPYFILVGAAAGYKNSQLFFQAFDRLFNSHGFDIICTGNSGILDADFRTFTVGSSVHMLQLSDEELAIAYSSSMALIYPSKYEGFGMPIIEAMASGCPVITCPNASIPEVADEAAIYVFDEDIDGMAEALCEVQKPQVRAASIAAGLERVKQFSWAKMADTIQSVLIDRTLTHLQLSEANLIIFPDWSQSEEELGEEIASVCYNLAQSSEFNRPTLLIDTTNAEDIESANMLVSGIAMNLMMAADLDITEYLEIALTGKISPIQWQALLPKLQGRIKLELEDAIAVESSCANLISEIQLSESSNFALV
ncbi:glycosyltransferase [Chamaesiphon sp. VAR_48_metabat_403]|uniref:glycosyltransferase n=1 Tax=Chamaesiphon sp. VAR_48_metabat_403 TaxID=2964700 RepID=UPI00286E7CD0|nr:glycosyltransferase [Chamaesiphon sp. VAR_48_metabat_403]